MHPTHPLATFSALFFLLCHFAAILATADTDRNDVDLPDISSISDQDPSSVVRFPLVRTELSLAYLGKRAIVKPYTVEEELSDLMQRERRRQELKQEGYGQHGNDVHSEPVVAVPLKDVPKEYGYTALISIGTYPSTPSSLQPSPWSSLFNLLVDTGSDQVVVTSAECTDAECAQIPHRYSCSASATCSQGVKNRLTGSPRWIQRYGDGTLANGTLVQDTLRFVSRVNAGANPSDPTILEVPRQSILVVDQAGLHLTKSYGTGVDGIIGLNLRSPVIPSTVIQNLQKTGVTASVSSPSSRPAYGLSSGLGISDSPFNGMGFMSLWLGKSYLPGEGGELLLNAVDKSRFRGPIRWSSRGPSPYDWSVAMDHGIQLHESTTDTTFFTVPETDHSFAVLDSGSDGIYVQRWMYHELYRQIPGAKQLANGFWRVPCKGTIALVFGINGVSYQVPYEDWVKKPNATASQASWGGPGMCQAKVYGSSPGPTLLGSAFLRTVYTVFDFSRPGYERVGFAALT
ncbi:aspartic peptidase domain-containing protein [Mortierella sp. GBAus27b]|nr:hypothetical protein BGX31_006006 [Mortierella sp. GBA43]KAI8352989.1 aspartic peptidase domain-containing protein [Mortierella sp. GBAus27b]